MEDYLPTNDLLWKKLFTSKDSQHILRAFVKDLLGIEFKTLTPKETYHIDSYKKSFEQMDLTHTAVDILATAEDGSHITLEMQIQPQQFFHERTVFYLAQAFQSPFANSESENFVKSDNYSALRPAYGINVIDFHLFDRKKPALQLFQLWNQKTEKPLLNRKSKELLQLCFLSLKNQTIEQNSAVHHWQQFFKTGEVAADAPEYIKDAKEKVVFYNLKEEEKNMIMQINKAKADEDARLSYARMKGLDEGLEKGQFKERIAIARNSLKAGLSIEQISLITGLNSDAIKSLKAEQE
ncbi:Rpn family recombination-promoting nuclease/putative transposase [Candidatus Enterococcus murrayae]|uniref:Rpn family recombination-promoting nuclease/putative transposase n=1 Tax=Candidatus Enterococcus murrayae TaxID=2815321 RepID=A0ABS3HEZ5_9ENTE|nr:Rpn family recombination-promoting nuclease/putative transposase [Enterococcus sp. MJM16]MBO0452037.1 Rpn family recombination-promoting nuclease/putative transposase [Enterococcus sp. MJM16]